MIKRFIHFFFRSLRFTKVYSIINIFGLSVGIATFLLIFLYADFESEYDRFHRQSDRIYRVIRECEWENGTENRADTGAPMGPLLKTSFPAVENTVRFTSFYEGVVSYEDRRFDESRLFFTDSTLFDVFTFPLETGDRNTVFSKPFSVVLTQSTARKYFGEDDPVGKVITYTAHASVDLTVTGVLEDIPLNSHLDFDFLVSYESLRRLVPPSFFISRWDSPTSNYVLLREGARPELLAQPLADFAETYVDKGHCASINLRLDPLEKIYYHSSNIGGGIWKRGNRQTTNTFLVLALFLLIVAGINYMNLATARSAARAKEIGIRKVMGVPRRYLVMRFLGESVFYSLMALLLGLLLVELLLPVFTRIVGIPLRPDYRSDYLFVAGFVSVMAGLFAGSYPAFFLSAFQPVHVLKGGLPAGSSALLRRGLVVFQFTLSIFLMMGATTAYRQIQYLQEKDMGFNKEHVVVLPIRGSEMLRQYSVIKDELLNNPNIRSVTAASQIPGVTSPNGIQMTTEETEDLSMPIVYVDFDYVETLELDVSSGRPFADRTSNDAREGLLINEAVERMLGWQGAEGNEVELFFKQGGQIIPMYDTRVVGVVKDFNFRALSMPIQPVLFKIAPNRLRYILARIEGNDAAYTVDYIEDKLSTIAPDQPFTFSFLSDEIDAVYDRFRDTYTIIQYVTILALLIACLGLFGLTSYMAENRIKEIGVRKVLGASHLDVLTLFIREISFLVVLATVIAVPLSYLGINNWLNNFAYRTNLSFWIILVSGLSALLLALVTVSYHAFRAVSTDPVQSLRYE